MQNKLTDDPHSLSVLKMLIYGFLARENYGEVELSKMISLHTDYLYEDVQFVIWLLKGEGSIVRINGGLGITPHYEPYQGAWTTTRNISTRLGKTT